jgi:hypothetical protein
VGPGLLLLKETWIVSALRTKCWGKYLDLSGQFGILRNEDIDDIGLYKCCKDRNIKKIAMGWTCISDEIGKLCVQNFYMEVLKSNPLICGEGDGKIILDWLLRILRGWRWLRIGFSDAEFGSSSAEPELTELRTNEWLNISYFVISSFRI